MLERLVVLHHPSKPGGPSIDVGLLIEQMLFYGEVHLYGGPGYIETLIGAIGPEWVHRLLELRFLRFHYFEQFYGVHNEDGVYFPNGFSIAATAGGDPRPLAPDKYVQTTIAHLEGKTRKKLGQNIVDKLIIDPLPADLPTNTVADFLNPSWMATAVAAVLAATNSPQRNAKFEVVRSGRGVRVETDIDFSKTTGLLATPTEPLTVAHVLSFVADAHREMRAAATEQAELYATGLGARLFEARLKTVIQPNAAQVEVFQEQVFKSSTAIRDAVNSRAVAVHDALKALESAAKFKDWVRNQPHDAKLLHEFISKVSAGDPFDKFGGKTARFLVCTAAGLLVGQELGGIAGIAVGTALGVADTFVLDRLLKQWKPGAFMSELQALFTKAGQ